MDYKPHPEKFDFKRDIMCINRTTGRMLLSALTLITPQKRGQQIRRGFLFQGSHSQSSWLMCSHDHQNHQLVIQPQKLRHMTTTGRYHEVIPVFAKRSGRGF